MNTDKKSIDIATFGGGCFWCIEAIFMEIEGVIRVIPGYTGGKYKNPSYHQVCDGETGHAEVIQVWYEPNIVSYDDLLQVFFTSHDPTTLNKQGADVGTQYRSVIYYHSAEQKSLAEKYKKELDAIDAFGKPIVTEISAATEFYPAEAYHQNYYNLNPEQNYCRIVIAPKLDKFRKVFRNLLRKK